MQTKERKRLKRDRYFQRKAEQLEEQRCRDRERQAKPGKEYQEREIKNRRIWVER